jgi:hypothetical protein
MTTKPESPLAPCPECGQPRACRKFRFDHEASDSAYDTANLQRLKSLGVELGAQVTVGYCAACDLVEAVFIYPGERAPS